MMSRPCVIALLLVLTACQGTQPPDTTAVHAKLEPTLTLLKTEGPERALPAFETLLKAYEEEGNEAGQAIVLGHIGTCYKNLGQYDLAVDYHLKALARKRSLGLQLEEAKTLSNLGLAYWEVGDYELAADHLEKSVTIARDLEDSRIEASVLNNLGLVYDEWGEYRRSLETYHASLEKQRAADDFEGQSYTLANIGGVHLLLGHFHTALDYYLQALELSRRLGLRPSESVDLGNVALCYLQLGESDRALKVLEEALQLAQETGQTKEQAYWHSGRGSALLRLGRYIEALDEYTKALQIYQTANTAREIVETLSQIGSLELLLGDIPKAESRFEQALQTARAIEHPREIVQNLIALGESARLSGRLERAEEYYSEALAYAVRMGDQASQTSSLIALARIELDRSRLPEARRAAASALDISRETGARPIEAISLKLLGDVEIRQGSAEHALQLYESAAGVAESVGDPDLQWRVKQARGLTLRDLGQLTEAETELEETIDLIESARFQLETQRQRAGFLDQRYQPYFDLVELLVGANEVDRAFHVAERLRASLLVDQLERAELPGRQGEEQPEHELQNRIRHLRSMIREEQEKPLQDQRSKALGIYQLELREAENSYRSTLEELTGDGNDFFLVPRVPSLAEIREQLPQRAALLEFLQTKERLFLFFVSRDKQRAFPIELTQDQLSSRLEIFLETIHRKKGDAWLGPSKSLYSSLIAPIEQEKLLERVDQLYLVPHEDLHYLPFAALTSETTGTPRFLADEFRLTYLPSAAFLVRRPPDGRPSQEMLALAPSGTRLQFVGEELQRLSIQFQSNSVILAGNDALESEFLRLAPGFRLIHLATHAQFDKLNPLRSSLDLAKGGGQDGQLLVSEILHMKIQAELVTLSACETALGGGYFAAMPPGGDFVGLTRAFLQAGSRSVLASLWQVDDRSTLELMGRFYSNLDDNGVAGSLNLAQRQLRSLEPRFRHPYYWAPFVLVSGYGQNDF